MLQTYPGFDAKIWSITAPPYKQRDLAIAIAKMLEADSASQKADGYQYDVVNLTRQLLGNQSATIRLRMKTAFHDKNIAAFRRESAKFLELIRHLDTLLGTRHEFLRAWIADARKWVNSAERAFYERNARQIITTWHRPGASLTDYSNRQWNGLVKTYYMARWAEFLKRAEESLAQNKPLDQGADDRWRIKFKATGSMLPAKTSPRSPMAIPLRRPNVFLRCIAGKLFSRPNHLPSLANGRPTTFPFPTTLFGRFRTRSRRPAVTPSHSGGNPAKVPLW